MADMCFPRHRAAASLKPALSGRPDGFLSLGFSAASGRGLIEARVGRLRVSGGRAFSAASGRGLIEATDSVRAGSASTAFSAASGRGLIEASSVRPLNWRPISVVFRGIGPRPH